MLCLVASLCGQAYVSLLPASAFLGTTRLGDLSSPTGLPHFPHPTSMSSSAPSGTESLHFYTVCASLSFCGFLVAYLYKTDEPGQVKCSLFFPHCPHRISPLSRESRLKYFATLCLFPRSGQAANIVILQSPLHSIIKFRNTSTTNFTLEICCASRPRGSYRFQSSEVGICMNSGEV